MRFGLSQLCCALLLPALVLGKIDRYGNFTASCDWADETTA